MWIQTVLVGALACAVLPGVAYLHGPRSVVDKSIPPGWVLCALTPMAVSMCSVVNPNGLEIAAAITLWYAGAVLALERLENPPIRLVAVIAGSATVLVSTRGLSPLLAFLIFATLIALAGPRAVVSLYRGGAGTCDGRWQ